MHVVVAEAVRTEGRGEQREREREREREASEWILTAGPGGLRLSTAGGDWRRGWRLRRPRRRHVSLTSLDNCGDSELGLMT